MKKLFEVSIRGSLYFYLSTISEQQVSQLQQFANQFYRSNSAYKYRADDEIMACFTISVKQEFDIELVRGCRLPLLCLVFLCFRQHTLFR